MSEPALTAVATLPVVCALLDDARRKRWESGVLGVRARPVWDGPAEFTHENTPVRVVACESALAVREALLDRAPGRWLVVITDRDLDDLGTGVLAHMLWHRPRTPDPWEAVRQKFRATGIDPALQLRDDHRDLASGLLAATPPGGWPPAPGGTLTRDHALGAVARRHLRVAGDGQEIDTARVLAWTADDDMSARIADLRTLGGNALTDAVLTWAAGRTGAAEGPVLALLRSGQGTDVVPMGIIVGLLAAPGAGPDAGLGAGLGTAQIAHDATVRLRDRLKLTPAPSPAVLSAWSTEAANVTESRLLAPDGRATVERLLDRAGWLLADLDASPLAEASTLLPAGLTARTGRLAAALHAAVARAPVTAAVTAPVTTAAAAAADVDAPLAGLDETEAVERAWAAVVEHRLADGDHRLAPCRAAVRLVRWLALPAGAAGVTDDLAALVNRHRDADAWVDRAVNDATGGVSDPDLGDALADVLTAVRLRRDAHDLAFARALAAHTRDDPPAAEGLHSGVRHLEDVLATTVLPLAKKTPVLLLVMDGMSVTVATEVVADTAARGWVEAVAGHDSRRGTALAVLPTLTEVSRTALLCGEPRTGGQTEERAGLAALARAHRLAGAELFHKKSLDTSRPGRMLADDVAAAIDDRDGRPLVACVLNTVDDALDRSDPAGTRWGVDTVRHLPALLQRAHSAERVVVLTADHGHVVERREGTPRPHQDLSSARSRPAPGPGSGPGDVGPGEVLVAGRRVLCHDGRRVLAVDERLRYGPLKAGYHGGASPAEAVVPVCVLVPGEVPDKAAGLLRTVASQEPPWWQSQITNQTANQTTTVATPATVPLDHTPAGPAPTGPTPAGPTPAGRARGRAAQTGPTLFDDPGGQLAPVALVDAVLGSLRYADQLRLAGRTPATPEQVRGLLTALLRTTGHRLAPGLAATALGVPQAMFRGAFATAQKVLNVEGYPVLDVDPDGATVLLDETLLREQFEVGP